MTTDNKEIWRPGNMIYPLPAMMVSCGATPDEYNVFTASWVGTICSDPAMCFVSIRQSRHSYEIVKRNMAFTLNLTNEDLARATDWCGVRSGRDYNKFAEMNLTPVKGIKVDAPYINEAPMSIECRVKQIIHLGTHDMFIADVMNVLADKRFIDPQTGEFDLKKANLIAYSHGEYFKLGEKIGNFGWSVKKK
ncbi:MAG: flavin reductase family protein [Muribaculaceae bacterium]